MSLCWLGLGYDATLLSHERKTISNFKIKIQNMSFEWFWFDKFQAIFIFKSFRDKSNLHQDENHFPFYIQHIWQLFISAMNFTLEWYEYNSVSWKWVAQIKLSHWKTNKYFQQFQHDDEKQVSFWWEANTTSTNYFQSWLQVVKIVVPVLCKVLSV